MVGQLKLCLNNIYLLATLIVNSIFAHQAKIFKTGCYQKLDTNSFYLTCLQRQRQLLLDLK